MSKAAFKSEVAPTFFTPQAAPPEELGRVIELNQKFSEGARSTAGKGPELVVEGARLELPATVARMLRDIVSELAKGAMVTLLPSHRELTTQEAADILNVSRTYMVRLLDEKAIPFTKVNKHRRIRADDLMSYKKGRDAARQEGLRHMTREAQKMGDYFGKKNK
jgi:excisionase family DNA binding protein